MQGGIFGRISSPDGHERLHRRVGLPKLTCDYRLKPSVSAFSIQLQEARHDLVAERGR
jgi:hypothetical protein